LLNSSTKAEEFDASKLTDLQYARYVAALLEEEGGYTYVHGVPWVGLGKF